MHFFRSNCNVSVAKLGRKWWCIRQTSRCFWSRQGIFFCSLIMSKCLPGILCHTVYLSITMETTYMHWEASRTNPQLSEKTNYCLNINDMHCWHGARLHTVCYICGAEYQISGKNGESTGNEGRKERMKEGEWDSRDTEKNRLTSLHLIGSSCNHKKKERQRKKNNRRQMIESRARQEKKKHKTARHIKTEREHRNKG